MVLVARESFEPSLMGSQLAVLPMRFDYFVPILYRRSGRGGIFGFLVIVFSVTYRITTPVERTIPSLATTITHLGRVQRHSNLSQVACLCTFLLWAYPTAVDVIDPPVSALVDFRYNRGLETCSHLRMPATRRIGLRPLIKQYRHHEFAFPK